MSIYDIIIDISTGYVDWAHAAELEIPVCRMHEVSEKLRAEQHKAGGRVHEPDATARARNKVFAYQRYIDILNRG